MTLYDLFLSGIITEHDFYEILKVYRFKKIMREFFEKPIDKSSNP